jgi:hypothetical protein
MNWIGGAFFAVFAIGAFVGWWASRQREDSQASQTHADKLDYPSDAGHEASIAALARAHIALAKDKASADKDTSTRDKKIYSVNRGTFIGVSVYTVITSVIMIISVIQFGSSQRFNKKQIGGMNGQLAVMSGQLNEMEITRRPWITADFHIAGPLEMKDGALTAMLGIVLRNTGQTPAIRTDIAIDAFPIQAFDIANSIRSVCTREDTTLGYNISIGPSVFPGEPKPTSIYNFSIPKDKIAEYRKTTYKTVAIMPIVALCVGYTEFGSDRIHHTSFILRYRTIDDLTRETKWTELLIKASDLMIQIVPVGNLPPD